VLPKVPAIVEAGIIAVILATERIVDFVEQSRRLGYRCVAKMDRQERRDHLSHKVPSICGGPSNNKLYGGDGRHGMGPPGNS